MKFHVLPPNTRLIHKTNNRLTLITVFCFGVDPPSVTSYETQEYSSIMLTISFLLYSFAVLTEYNL
jgi:hypothetical protein